MPVVLADRMIPGSDKDTVLTNNTESVYKATSHLISEGHRRIGIISGPKSVFTAKERLVGYLRALSDNGIIYDDSLVISGDNIFATGYQGLISMMSLNTPPTAIFSTNYNITLGLITSARERGIVIPDQVSVFGYDSVDVCRMMTPALRRFPAGAGDRPACGGIPNRTAGRKHSPSPHDRARVQAGNIKNTYL